MIFVIILSATLCAAVCLWVLKPLKNPRQFIKIFMLSGMSALGLYLFLGHPEIPAHPTQISAQTQTDMRLESTLMSTLEKNPDDANALIRLAALRIAQGRTGEQTIKILNHAERVAPNDKRIKIIRKMTRIPD